MSDEKTSLLTPENIEKIKELKEYMRVYHNDEFLYWLNPFFVLTQNLEKDNLDKITKLHNELHDLFKEIEECTEPKEYPNYIQKVETIEYALQEAWKFDRDATKHSWWYKIPHCQCPDLDNRERWGVAQRVINKECPVHGELLELHS